jgi:Zn-dependent protease
MFAEPPRTQADLCFSLLGFPVRIHPLFWLVAIVLGQGYWSPPEMALLWVAGVLLCILLHELGHAAVLRAYGFRPWIVLHGFGGLTIHGPGDALARRPGPWGQILISAAGPAAGFLLAALIVAGGLAIDHGTQRLLVLWCGPASFLRVVPQVIWLGAQWPKTADFVNILLEVSVLWGLLNLLPIFPLDGGQIARQIFLLVAPRDAVRQSLILSVLVAGTLAGLAAIYGHDYFLAIFFAYLAYTSYATMTFYGGPMG